MVKTLLSLCMIISLFVSTYSANKSFVTCLTKNNASSIVYSPTNSSFAKILNAYIKNKRFERPSTHKPTLILTPTEEAHVSTAVRCAAAHNIHIKIRCGGHDYDGTSYVSQDDFVILDMFNLRSIYIDMKRKTAYVESGALLGELYYEIAKKSKTLAFPAGVCPTVAVGGHISGGGYGNMLRKFGLTIDNLLDARVVVANGSILNRETMGEDLFWAIRGGGGASFAVILSYTIQLVTIPPYVTVFRVERYQSQNASGILYDYQNIAPYLDNGLFIRVLLQPKTSTLCTTYIGMYIGSAKSLLKKVITPNFPSLGLTETDCKEMSWINSVLFWSNFDSTTKPEVLLNRSTTADDFGYLKRKSDYVKSAIEISDMEKIFKTMVDIGKVGMVFNTYGGRMSEISDKDTAFPHRRGNLFKIQYYISWKNASIQEDDEYMKKIRDLYHEMTPYVSHNPRESYFNYRDLDIGTNRGRNSYAVGKVYGKKYFKCNYNRLVKIKTDVDPGNFFRNEQSIPTLQITG